jgi:hypothetical protein
MFARHRLLLTFSLSLVVPSAHSHHAFAAVFDGNNPFEVVGTVTKIEWMNPHTWFYIAVDNSGTLERWALEMGSPNGLVRRGWSRHTLQIGQEVRVAGYRAKDGSLSGSVKSVRLSDGTELSGASSRGRERAG